MGYGAFYVICPRASSQYVTPLWITRSLRSQSLNESSQMSKTNFQYYLQIPKQCSSWFNKVHVTILYQKNTQKNKQHNLLMYNLQRTFTNYVKCKTFNFTSVCTVKSLVLLFNKMPSDLVVGTVVLRMEKTLRTMCQLLHTWDSVDTRRQRFLSLK